MILRSGTIDWPGGAGTITAWGVSPVLVDASLQVTSDAGIGWTAIRRSWAGQDTTELAAAARERREAVVEHNAVARRMRERRVRASGLLTTLSDCISAAAAAGEGDAATWAADIESIHARMLARAAEESDAAERHNEISAALAKISAAMESASAKWRLTARVEVALQAPAGPVALSLRYLVPAALWRPAYRAVLRPVLRSEGPDEDARMVTGCEVELTAQASIWQRTGEDWPAVPITLSTARPSTGATLPPLHTDRLSIRDKTAAERKTIQVRSWDQTINKASLTDDEGLPGVDDGGEARVLSVARPLAVPSTGRPHRVLVDQGTVPVEVRYRCIPERSLLVFREVELRNPLPHPLLAGPVTLITDGGASGIGEIPFVAPGEQFPLSFGSQDNVSVRYVKRAEVEERFALADYRWLSQEVMMVNTGDESLLIELILRTPVSELKQVEVVLDRDRRSSAGMEGPDEQGFVRWRVSLSPGEKVSRRVAFRIEKASNVQLPDFW